MMAIIPIKHISILFKILLTISVFLRISSLQAQAPYSNPRITEIIESIAEETEGDYDYSALADQLYEITANPININSDKIRELGQIGILSNIQIINIRKYIDEYGIIQSIWELQFVEGFNKENIQRIAPFVTTGDISEKEQVSFGEILKNGKHDLLFRFSRLLERPEGFQTVSDSAWIARPNSHYLGDQNKLYLRYRYHFPGKIKIGFLAEKDPGEVLLIKNINDSIKELAGKNLKSGADLYSGFLYLENTGIIKKVVIGDYLPCFGQGLTMWPGFSMGKTPLATDIKKHAPGFRPGTSVNENGIFRGGAAEIRRGRISVTGFYSNNKIDGNITRFDSLSGEAIEVSSLQTTGFHRTINELRDKDAVARTVYGGNLRYRHYHFQLGITAFKTMLNADLSPSEKPHNYYSFNGKENFCFGFDYDIMIGKMNHFGEVSGSQNGGKALLAGLSVPLQSRIDLSVLYRNYGIKYQSLFSQAFAENSVVANEHGIYCGITSQVSKRIRISSYLDLFRFPWVKFGVSTPSNGKEYLIEANYSGDAYSCYIRYKYKEKGINNNEVADYLSPVDQYKKQNFRFHIDYSVGERWRLSNRFEISDYTFDQSSHPGYLMYQDLGYHTPDNKLNIRFRYTLFDVNEYDARIYAYENDVLYAFSVPAYFGQGSRVYGLVNYKISRGFHVWFRYGITVYTDRTKISSGMDEIEGNKKSEVKVQLRYKF